jgi:hypothetical protein
LSVQKKVTLQLDVGKTVVLMGFNVSGSNTVCFKVKFVEFEHTIPYCFDFSGYPAWKAANPTLTWRDYVKRVLLDLYDSFLLAKQLKDMLDSEAV